MSGRTLWVRRTAAVLAVVLGAVNLAAVAIEVGPDGFLSLLFGALLLYLAPTFWPDNNSEETNP